MEKCPHCETPYEKGQRYCSNCGSFLLHPEKPDTFCPQCGIRVSPRQQFCHECDAPMKGEGAVAAPEPAPGAAPPEAAPAPGKGMQPWVIGLLAGSGVIIIILLVLLFSRVSQLPAPPVTPQAKAPAATPTTPAAPQEAAPKPTATLRDNLLSVLSTLREAHLKKDIVLYMSAYSLTFPELDQKRTDTLTAWENYDYTNLAFTLDDIQEIDADNVVARATWYIDTRNRRTQDLASSTQIYRIRFVKELGKWRIRSLEEID